MLFFAINKDLSFGCGHNYEIAGKASSLGFAVLR
ncbi:MAG: hypothetical protein JWM28_179 [Chitinophagaceae bacterium]|nr:hypothetical protein [Chitinophagaceae bacterium]